MARTKTIPPEGLLSDLEYTSVIVSYSNGIDSTGTLYYALRNFPKTEPLPAKAGRFDVLLKQPKAVSP